ncbi:MAG TPA: hypothetical protein VLF39_03200 [Candidatus Saccharimonadales bacterium]|nr:hypothetical protein [Candidatus Saccharimonadales bacterium]
MDDDTKDIAVKTDSEDKSTSINVSTPGADGNKPADDWSDAPASSTNVSTENLTASPANEIQVNSDGKLSGASDNNQVPKTSLDLKAIETPNGPTTPQSMPDKKKNGKMVIIVAVVVFLILAVAAYFAYKNNQKTTKTSTSTSTVASTKLTTSDIDQTNQDIDKQLNSTNDTKDFSSSDLSDTALGL